MTCTPATELNTSENQSHLLDGLESMDRGTKLLWWKQTTQDIKLFQLETKMDEMLFLLKGDHSK